MGIFTNTTYTTYFIQSLQPDSVYVHKLNSTEVSYNLAPGSPRQFYYQATANTLVTLTINANSEVENSKKKLLFLIFFSRMYLLFRYQVIMVNVLLVFHHFQLNYNHLHLGLILQLHHQMVVFIS